jgi:hypothetical protein
MSIETREIKELVNALPLADATGSALRASEAYLAKCPEPMSRSDAAIAVALVLVEARERIARLAGELEAAEQHVRILLQQLPNKEVSE